MNINIGTDIVGNCQVKV